MAVKLQHSFVLFTDEDGSPLVFQLWPCSERKNLRPLIEHGGGSLTSKRTNKSIKLATPDSTVKSAEYVSTCYIYDCVKQNKLLDMSSYRMGKAGDQSTSSIHLDEDLNHAPVIIKTVSRDRKGRKKFTLAEDNNIIKFLMEERRYTEMKGNAVWKDMEMLKITSHTHQSMKDRFKKTILPNIHQYAIPRSWISALTGNISDVRSSPGSTSSRISSRLPSLSPNVILNRLSFSKTSPPPLQSTPVKTRTALNKALLETMDISDEDDFDKQLYKLSVPEKEAASVNLSIIQPISGNDMKLGSVVLERVETRNLRRVVKSKEPVLIDSSIHNTGSSTKKADNPIQRDIALNTHENEVNVCKTTPTPVSREKKPSQKRKKSGDDEAEGSDSSYVTSDSPRRSPKKGPDTTPRKAPSQRKHKKSSYKDSKDDGKMPSCTALIDFIMNSQETENSQESQSSADEGKNLGTDLEDCANPSEVKKHCQIIKKLCGHFNLSPSEVLQALWANSGSLRNTVHWIHHGMDASGRPAWTEKDDKVLQSASAEDINMLRRKYGSEKVDQRAAFLEDSCFNK